MKYLIFLVLASQASKSNSTPLPKEKLAKVVLYECLDLYWLQEKPVTLQKFKTNQRSSLSSFLFPF